jgi:glutathione peroxidase
MKRPILAVVLLLLLSTLGVAAAPRTLDWAQIPLPGIEGGALPAEQFRGKVVMVVNTASFCGYTYQYKALEQVWARYRDRGLVLLGVPSNDFGDQEPGSDAAIKAFCDATFGVDFPMLAKQDVRGDKAHELFRWFSTETNGAGAPRWNFYKYLIGRDGRLISWYSNTVEPDAETLIRALEQALAATA